MAQFDGHVVGTWLKTNGDPATGYVFLKFPSAIAPLLSADDGLVGSIIRLRLVDGAIDAYVPATDDPDIQPTNWTYEVHVLIDGAHEDVFNIAVIGGVDTDIPTAARVAASSGDPSPDAIAVIQSRLADLEAQPKINVGSNPPEVDDPTYVPAINDVWIQT